MLAHDGCCGTGMRNMPERRPVSIDDLFRLRLVSDPRLSPDGERVAYVVARTELEKNKYFSRIHVVRTDGSDDRPFTGGDYGDSTPRWSPDGRSLAFISNRDEQSQLWRIPLDGGEAVQLTRLEEGGIGDYAWSPDGAHIAFTFRKKPEWATKKAREEREKNKRSTPPMILRSAAYREEGAGYIGDEHWHLRVLHVESGEVRQLTHAAAEPGDLAWSPGGTRLAFTTNRTPNPDLTRQFTEIRIVPLEGGPEEHVAAPEGPKGALAWSPDGQYLAYRGNTDTRDVWSATDPHLWVLPLSGGEARDLTAHLDRPIGDAILADLRSFGGGWVGPTWAPDSRSLLILVSDQGASHVYRVPLEGGEPENLTPGYQGEVASISIDAAGRRIASVVGDVSTPGDVCVAELGVPLRFQAVSHTHDEWLSEVELAPVEEVWAPSPEGAVHGWLMRPAELEGPVPLILYIHGGPHTMYGWSMLHEFQLLAASGFAVLYTNPRGSRGYGQEQIAALRGDWGGPDYRDVMAALDHVVTLPGIDGERMGVTGGSYGGYLTNWIIGHTDRFRCAVTQRSVVNLHSMGGTCDFTFCRSDYFGGNTWSEPEALWAQSPLKYVGNVCTPLLIIHSEGDLRCPIEQAEQLFAALRMLEREVEFVRYPREANHGLSRSGPPDLRRDRLERIIGWLERWLK